MGSRQHTKNKNIRQPGTRTILSVGLLALLGTTLLAIALGSVNISLLTILRTIGTVFGLSDDGIDPAVKVVILSIRIPRVAAAILAGSGLAVAGTIMQGIFRNPLAEPGILGVSAGSSLGALIAISAGATAFFVLPVFAFFGAMLAGFGCCLVGSGGCRRKRKLPTICDDSGVKSYSSIVVILSIGKMEHMPKDLS